MRLSYQQQGVSGNVGSGDSGDLYVGYDRFGRTVKMPWYEGIGGSQTTLEEVEYGFDRAGARQWKQRPVASNGGQDEFYNYDGLHQISGSARGDVNINRTAIGGVPVEQEGFEYDPSGNWRGYQRWVEGEATLDQSREHNQDNQMVQIDGSSAGMGYDLSGNATQLPPQEGGEWSGSYRLKWDAWNRLVKVSLEDETEVGRYEYDGQHRRTKRVAGGVTRTCLYNDQWKLVEQWGDVAGYHEQYVWGTRHRDELILRDRDTDGNGSMDERLLMLHDYYSPLSVSNSSGTVLERYGYSAFGIRRVMDGSFEPREGSSYDLEYAFQGQFRDSETGFYNYGYRYYSPDLGRWLNRDPIEEQGGLNLYALVGNNPVNSVDRLGLWNPIEGGIAEVIDRATNIGIFWYPKQCSKPLETRFIQVFWYNNTPRENGGTVDKPGVGSSDPDAELHAGGPDQPYYPQMNPNDTFYDKPKGLLNVNTHFEVCKVCYCAVRDCVVTVGPCKTWKRFDSGDLDFAPTADGPSSGWWEAVNREFPDLLCNGK